MVNFTLQSPHFHLVLLIIWFILLKISMSGIHSKLLNMGRLLYEVRCSVVGSTSSGRKIFLFPPFFSVSIH